MCDVRWPSGARFVLQATQIGLDFVRIALQLHIMGEGNVCVARKRRETFGGAKDHNPPLEVALELINQLLIQRYSEAGSVSCPFAGCCEST